MTEEIKNHSPAEDPKVATPAAEATSTPAEGSEGAHSETLSSKPREGEEAAGSSPQTSSPSKDEQRPQGQWPKSAVDRVAKLTARLREYEARGVGAPAPVNPETGVQFTQTQIDAMIEERASIKAQQNAFTTQCNEAARRGATKFPDWQGRLENLVRLKDDTDPRSVQSYNMFLQAALETGEAETIIHRLGGNIEEAASILSLSPIKMALEVGKLVNRAPEVEPTRLPKPIRPVGSSSPSTAARPDDPERGSEIPMKEWVKARDAQVLEKRRGG